jgi:hypothetical protein
VASSFRSKKHPASKSSQNRHHRIPELFEALEEYFLRAERSQALRLERFLILWQAFNAFASFCARVNGLGVPTGTGGKFPAPENVALAGAPNTGAAAGAP